MSTITKEQEAAIRDFVFSHHIPSGLGTEEEACTVAAINLQLSGRLVDEIPDCMSYVIGRWIIGVQDAMPDEMRNSPEWKTLIPIAAGTGRDAADERERFCLIIEWMNTDVLATVQPIADKRGFGEKWRVMCESGRAYAGTLGAADAAYAAGAADAADAARAALLAQLDAAYAAGAADAARAARAAESKRAWDDFNPAGLLAALVAVGKRR